jgi:histidinol-phosphate aminotransferase
MNGSPAAKPAPRRPYVRASYDAIRLYAPDRRAAPVDLSDNTNRWGMPPASRAVLRALAEQSGVRYPSLYANQLKSALASYAGVGTENIVTGCGSDDVLDSAIRACSEPGDLVVAPSPVFPMIPLFARMNGLSFASVPMSGSFDVDVQALVARDPAIVYLCSPNNPTGTVLPPAVVRDVLANSRALVIVDEAYIEFGGESVAELIRDSARLLVVRTLSKAFGLAGLRVGYALGAPELVAAVEKSRGPYKVNALAEAAGVAALTEGLPWVRERIADVVELRGELTGAMERRGVSVLPSSANFILCAASDSEAIAREMRDRGVAVRPFASLESGIQALNAAAGSALRISIGPRPEIDAMLAAFDQARPVCE